MPTTGAKRVHSGSSPAVGTLTALCEEADLGTYLAEVTSRAIAENGEGQPVPDGLLLAGKTTYWESNGQITRRVHIS